MRFHQYDLHWHHQSQAHFRSPNQCQQVTSELLNQKRQQNQSDHQYLKQLPMRKVSARGEVAWVHLDNVDAWQQERGGVINPARNASPGRGRY